MSAPPPYDHDNDNDNDEQEEEAAPRAASSGVEEAAYYAAYYGAYASTALQQMLDGALGEGTVANTELAFAAPPGTPMGPEEMAHTVKLLERLFSNGLPGVEATWMRS